MGERWYPAVIVAVLLSAMVYALHMDLSQPLQPWSPSAPTQEQKEPSQGKNRESRWITLPVEIIPSKEHTSETADQKRQTKENAATENDLTDATWKLAYFTLALAIFASGQVALFFWQLGLIRESLDDAKIAAEAARDGAAAARDGADISRSQTHYGAARDERKPA